MQTPSDFTTNSGLKIKRTVRNVNADIEKDRIITSLDSVKGVYLKSSFEYPGRYKRWDTGFINPPVEIRTKGYEFTISMLNERGLVLLENMARVIEKADFLKSFTYEGGIIKGEVERSKEYFSEENRSKKNTSFSIIRLLMDSFKSDEDHVLGLYGAFGFDLIFQFEDIEMKKERNKDGSDMVLFIPDQVFVRDNELKQAFVYSYEFEYENFSSEGLKALPFLDNYSKYEDEDKKGNNFDEVKGKYEETVRGLKDYFKRGDLFEVVPSRELRTFTKARPSRLFESLIRINPSPYGFFMNLGAEHLIGASPEMFVRVDGKRIETCPISGTIKRGKDAIEDSLRINEILNSKKDESELTMCTDVDRNDKSRVCVPGSVKVIGRRQIEMYSHLIHTVDHVEGVLRDEFDGLDGFMSHMWAVTVTGAPKRAAIQWIEDNEETSREWYGGAVGFIRFDGSVNTGLTLRTIKLKNGEASVRVGATILYDSDPVAEEEETLIKAGAMLKVLKEEEDGELEGIKKAEEEAEEARSSMGTGLNILFVDHEDSFVNTLADYFRRTGANVETYRSTMAREFIENSKKGQYDLIVLSPGPGSPDDFQLSKTIELSMEKEIPIFGVCLGLQGLTEYFGGALGQLEVPYHGKDSRIYISNGKNSLLFKGLPKDFNVGRYHSLYAMEVPKALNITAISENSIPMAIEHISLPIAAVQFHPESIMTMENENGFKIIQNVVKMAKKHKI